MTYLAIFLAALSGFFAGRLVRHHQSKALLDESRELVQRARILNASTTDSINQFKQWRRSQWVH